MSLRKTSARDSVPVWVYVIFRKNPSSGHDKVSVNVSNDGPVFWTRHVVYVFCCSCHFERHEASTLKQLIDLFNEAKGRIERVCLVDRPLDYPFLPDSLFSYMSTDLPNLQFVYLRELDLEKINRGTVERLSKHRNLKKLIVHGCRNYEVLQDFRNLPQLLVVKGEIAGLKGMLGDLLDFDNPSLSLHAAHGESSSAAQSEHSSSCNGSSLSAEDDRVMNTPSPITVDSQ